MSRAKCRALISRRLSEVSAWTAASMNAIPRLSDRSLDDVELIRLMPEIHLGLGYIVHKGEVDIPLSQRANPSAFVVGMLAWWLRRMSDSYAGQLLPGVADGGNTVVILRILSNGQLGGVSISAAVDGNVVVLQATCFSLVSGVPGVSASDAITKADVQIIGATERAYARRAALECHQRRPHGCLVFLLAIVGWIGGGAAMAPLLNKASGDLSWMGGVWVLGVSAFLAYVILLLLLWPGNRSRRNSYLDAIVQKGIRDCLSPCLCLRDFQKEADHRNLASRGLAVLEETVHNIRADIEHR